MSLYIVDIHGEIEGDYEIIGKYEEPKTGHWIVVDRWFTGERVRCSECNQVFIFGDEISRNFCPNCGADMRADRSEE